MNKVGSFSFEGLEVWQKAVDFADTVIGVLDNLDAGRKHYRLIEQAESAVSSIAMNIAEGKGRYSKKEFVHYLFIARGSLFETVTLLAIFHRRGWLGDDELLRLKAGGIEIGKMLTGLANSIKKAAVQL